MSKRLGAIVALCTILGTVGQCYGQSLEEVRDRVMPSVALVMVTRDPLQPGSSAPAKVLWQGSGFVVDQSRRR
jgi:hypothetical protein